MKTFKEYKVGDKVTIQNAKKYDALSPEKVTGEVWRIGDDGRIGVTVGSGSMNVEPNDLRI